LVRNLQREQAAEDALSALVCLDHPSRAAQHAAGSRVDARPANWGIAFQAALRWALSALACHLCLQTLRIVGAAITYSRVETAQH